MPDPRGIAVFCGSRAGARPEYIAEARSLGAMIAQSGRPVVFGGGGIGMMGAVADGALSAEGEVIGVIPESLVEKEAAHQGVQDMRVVQTMSERKAIMFAESSAAIILPGGIGTLDELFDAATLTSLGHISCAVGIVNIHGYYDALLAWVSHAATEGYLDPTWRQSLVIAESGESVLEQINNKL